MNNAEVTSYETVPLSVSEVAEIKARIKKIDDRLNDLYFQNGQDIESGGLGDGNDEEIVSLTNERAELYKKQGLMSPEEVKAQRKNTIDTLISKHLNQTQGWGYGSGLDGEE